MTNHDRYDAIRRQYAAGARGLDMLHARAVKLGRKVNGYTATELASLAAEQHRLSQLDDDGLCRHLQGVNLRIRARLADLHAE